MNWTDYRMDLGGGDCCGIDARCGVAGCGDARGRVARGGNAGGGGGGCGGCGGGCGGGGGCGC